MNPRRIQRFIFLITLLVFGKFVNPQHAHNVISLIRKLSNPKRNIEVVWVEGNHDADLTQVMEHLIGVKVYQQYEWYWQGKKCIAMHGHQFDSLFATGNPWFNGIVTEVYIRLQKVNFLKRWLPRILDKLHTNYQRLTYKVAEGAIHVAEELKADYIFCGHTHQKHFVNKGAINYYNVGCWVDHTGGTYAALQEDGKLALYEYRKS